MDRRSEALLVGRLLGARPDDGILGEEGADHVGRAGVRWIVDPIDGTVNYLYGLPSWAVSVAAEIDGVVVVGVVVAPVLRRDVRRACAARARACTTTHGVRTLRVNDPVALDRGAGRDRLRLQHRAAHRPGARGRRRDPAACATSGAAAPAASTSATLAAGRLDAYYERGPHGVGPRRRRTGRPRGRRAHRGAARRRAGRRTSSWPPARRCSGRCTTCSPSLDADAGLTRRRRSRPRPGLTIDACGMNIHSVTTTTTAPSAAPAVMTTRVLDAALAVFTERTYAGAAVPQVAERAGIGVGTIYRSFPGKEELANAVYRRAQARACSTTCSRPSSRSGPAPPSRDRVAAVWSGLAAYAGGDPDGFAFLEHQQHAAYLDDESRAVLGPRRRARRRPRARRPARPARCATATPPCSSPWPSARTSVSPSSRRSRGTTPSRRRRRPRRRRRLAPARPPHRRSSDEGPLMTARPQHYGAALVTGCSTGIGRATALALTAAGFTVYATARRPETLADLAETGHPHARPRRHRRGVDGRGGRARRGRARLRRRCWSTTPATRCRARSRTPRLDAVRAQFETNVFGLVRLTPARAAGDAPARATAGSSTSARWVGASPSPAAATTTRPSTRWRPSATRCGSRSRRSASQVSLVQPGPVTSAFVDSAVDDDRGRRRPVRRLPPRARRPLPQGLRRQLEQPRGHAGEGRRRDRDRRDGRASRAPGTPSARWPRRSSPRAACCPTRRGTASSRTAWPTPEGADRPSVEAAQLGAVPVAVVHVARRPRTGRRRRRRRPRGSCTARRAPSRRDGTSVSLGTSARAPTSAPLRTTTRCSTTEPEPDEAVRPRSCTPRGGRCARRRSRSPITVGRSAVQCTTVPSWIEVRAPTLIVPWSPRSTAVGQTVDSGPMRTSPMTTASGCTKAVGSIVGTRSPRA